MNKSVEILSILRPNGGWTIQGDDLATVEYYDNCAPLTTKEITDGEKLLAAKIAEKIAARQAILDRLGITKEEARLLLG